MSTNCPSGKDLLAYAERRAQSAEASRIKQHLESCASCRAEVESLLELTTALTSVGRDADGELDDLVLARRHDAPAGSDAAVERTLARLRNQPSFIVMRATEHALTYVDGWVKQARDWTVGTGFDGRVAALAGIRGESAPVKLHWSTDEGYQFDCEVTRAGSRPELVGRVLRNGSPAIEVSVALRGSGIPHGPESVDAVGRFGPWELGPGASLLSFEALDLPDGELSITLDLQTACEEATDPTRTA